MRNAPSCIVLMGIPGSGKSSFANHLVSLNSWLVPRNWEHVNQDECGSSSDFWSRLQSCARDKNKRIIVDRCNVKKSDRNQVIEALMLGKSIKGSKDVTLIFFDISKEICYERISNRKDHPTISITKAKTKGEKIISSFSQQLEKPSKDEGFGVIHNITSEEEAHNLLSSWGCDVHSLTSSFFKFPRTHHLLDVGGSSVSRDDLLLDAFELKDYFGPNSKPLLIQEKVDGANLGISITKDFEVRDSRFRQTN
jgi:predicted kinase